MNTRRSSRLRQSEKKTELSSKVENTKEPIRKPNDVIEKYVADVEPEDFDDEFEEKIMVLELNGVLDAESVRQAARNGQITVRNADGSDPLVQVGSSVYSGQWTQTLGTDMIFCSSSPATVVEGNMPGNAFITTEQPEATSTFCNITPGGHTSTIELLAVSQTRLTANKALITMDSGVKAPIPDSQAGPATAESSEILDALMTEESTSKSSETLSSGKTEDKRAKKGRYG